MILAALVLLAAVVAAVAIANTRRYRRVVKRPGYITTPQGHRRLP